MLPLYSCCSRLLQLVCAVLMQCAAPEHHHRKTGYLCQITTTTKYVIYLFRVRVSFVACRLLLRWINTYYLCAVSCSVMGGYCLSVDISVLWFIVFIQSLMFRYIILDLVAYRHYKDSTLLLWYAILQADFLLVDIYTLGKWLRDRELRGELVHLRQIQRIFVHIYTLLG